MTKSQKDRVIGKLKTDGNITRNQCLNNYISRLSAIIQDLEEDGWEFRAEKIGNDYKYTVITSPLKKILFKVADGREVIKYE